MFCVQCTSYYIENSINYINIIIIENLICVDREKLVGVGGGKQYLLDR